MYHHYFKSSFFQKIFNIICILEKNLKTNETVWYIHLHCVRNVSVSWYLIHTASCYNHRPTDNCRCKGILFQALDFNDETYTLYPVHL